MKVSTILNNYQINSYAHRIFKSNIIKEIRLDKYHTKVIWNLEESQVKLLQKVCGRNKIQKEV